MSELADLTVTELLAAFRDRDATPVEAVESCLRRVDSLDARVGAVLSLEPERALALAATAGERWLRGEARALEGVPYGAKDIILTAGVRTTGGSAVYEELVPTTTAAVVTRLEDAGAVRLAKLQTYEFAVGSNAVTRNPWGREYWASGSSSGSAAAVAARELPLALGTDTGGSIAIPSALCGISGLKPTYGRVPRSGVMALSWTLDHVGPMARSVPDLALALIVLAGHDPLDPTSSSSTPPDYLAALGRPLDELRIGVPGDWFLDRVHPEIQRAVDDALALLVESGASVQEISLPATCSADPHAIEVTIILAELASLHSDPEEDPSLYGPEFGRLYKRAQFISALDYLHALRARHLIQRDFEAAFSLVDVIVAPAVVYLTPRLDDLRADIGAAEPVALADIVARTTAIFNIAGTPTVTVPAGFDSRGLPIGIQFAAAPHADAVALCAAHRFQQLTDHHRSRPPLLDEPVPQQLTGSPTENIRPVNTSTLDRLW